MQLQVGQKTRTVNMAVYTFVKKCFKNDIKNYKELQKSHFESEHQLRKVPTRKLSKLYTSNTNFSKSTTNKSFVGSYPTQSQNKVKTRQCAAIINGCLYLKNKFC